MIIEVHELDEHDEVCCYFCQQDGDHRTYKKGEAFLAGPDHSPCDGNANYICGGHLDADVEIVAPGGDNTPSTLCGKPVKRDHLNQLHAPRPRWSTCIRQTGHTGRCS